MAKSEIDLSQVVTVHMTYKYHPTVEQAYMSEEEWTKDWQKWFAEQFEGEFNQIKILVTCYVDPSHDEEGLSIS